MGQKNGHARIWAKTGTRPRLPADQRYANAYLFGAICPMGAKGAALVLPFANTRAMQMHLDEISCNVAAKAHGVVLMDCAGWHSTDKLKVPKILTIILLPSRSPELNPIENIWQYLRQNWLSNRVFEDYDAIIEAGCQAWNKLINQPKTMGLIYVSAQAYLQASAFTRRYSSMNLSVCCDTLDRMKFGFRLCVPVEPTPQVVAVFSNMWHGLPPLCCIQPLYG